MNNMDKFCLNWNGYDTNIRESFRKLREDQRLFDVTLVTDDGQHIQAHKIILSAGSLFFNDIFLKSNQTNMLMYLRGINSVHLEPLLDFIYNGEASVGQKVIEEFLHTGKELQVTGFEANFSDVGESEQEDPVIDEDKKENRDNFTEENSVFDTLESASEHHDSSMVAFKGTNEGKVQINTDSDLDLQLLEMIERSDGVWKCKVCGKTNPYKSNLLPHAASHIEGMSHACHICNKSYPNRPCLRAHKKDIHSELMSCDLCGKSGMNKKSYYHHKRTHHKTFSEILL